MVYTSIIRLLGVTPSLGLRETFDLFKNRNCIHVKQDQVTESGPHMKLNFDPIILSGIMSGIMSVTWSFEACNSLHCIRCNCGFQIHVYLCYLNIYWGRPK